MDKKEVTIEIKGNKFNIDEINNMLNDYIGIGENVFQRKSKLVEILLKEFIKKYRKKGNCILSRKRNLKQFLNSAKSIYRLAEFSLCHDNKEIYNKYVYMLNKNSKGSKVYVTIKFNKEIVLIYHSISDFLESWYIYKLIRGDEIGE